MAHVLRAGSPGKVVIGTIDAERALRAGEVRLESLLSAISHGTELHFVRGTSPFAGKHFDSSLRAFAPGDDASEHDPDVLGYEMISVVTEVAPDVCEVEVGDFLHTGSPHQDRTIVDLAQQRAFGYPATVLPRGRPLEPGLFISLGSVALQAVHDARIKAGDRVLVSGLGAIGLLTAQLVLLSGASMVMVSDPLAERRALALQLGAAVALDPVDLSKHGGLGLHLKRIHGARGVDVAIETSGAYPALHDSIAAVGVGGRVVSVGFYQGEAQGLRLGEEWHHNRPDLVSSMGVWGCPHRDHPLWDRQRLTDAIRDLLYSGKIQTDRLLTHRVPFREAQRGYDLIVARPQDVLKVALVFERPS